MVLNVPERYVTKGLSAVMIYVGFTPLVALLAPNSHLSDSGLTVGIGANNSKHFLSYTFFFF